MSLCTAAEARKPNVLIIFTDDQGSVDAGCYGAKDLQTPNIDALSKRGVRFTQFYAAAPVCSPSRAGLLTARYPVRAGVPGNVSSQQGQSGMPVEQVTIAETFRAAGFATAHIGKWHLGYEPKTMPGGQGFDYTFGHMGGCIDNFSHFFYWNGPNRHDLWRNGKEVHAPGRFFGDLMLEEATAFIKQHQKHPFFMYYAINMPHYPYQGDPEWLDRYRDVKYPRNLYNAFVSTFDARIGQLLATVDALGLREETIVVFQSDHGHSTEVRAHLGGGSAGPYRGAKFSLFEGGIRVPAIISWPGHLPAGEVRHQIAHSCDWLPTVAELCDIPLVQKDIDGRSITGMIRSASAKSPHEVLHWTIGKSWAVRSGPWKLIGNPRDTSKKGPLGKDDKLFLVNLEQDKTEMTNLAGEHPGEVQRLKRLHDQWQAGVQGK
jgi:arylsulfatase A-like enzyme